MSLDSLIIQGLSGISVGMVLFLIAAGLSIIFGSLKILNLSHGSIYMLSAFLCFWLISKINVFSPNLSFWITLLIAPVCIAIFGGLLEVYLLRKIYNRDMLYQYILTFALILIIGDGCKYLFGVGYQTINIPWPLKGTILILRRNFPVYNFFLIICGFLSYFILYLTLNYTKLGHLIRAVTHNREIASALGINVPLVYTMVFMLGCYLAGLAGALMPPMSVVALGSDMAIIIDCFIIVVIGGMGSLTGAFFGSLLLGLFNAFGILVIPKMAIAFPFMLMIVILIFRPWGLFGKQEQ